LQPKDRIIVAMDMPHRGAFLLQTVYLAKEVGMFHIGLKPFLEHGHRSITSLQEEGIGGKVMLDLNLHAIPPVMGSSAAAIAALNVQAFTIHASAGPDGIEASVRNRGACDVIGVTVLTSHGDEQCASIFGELTRTKVRQFGRWLIECGAQGVICAGQEVALIRQEVDPDRRLTVIAAAIRPDWYPEPSGPQRRHTTPTEAIKAGADRLLIGKPIYDQPGTQCVQAVRRLKEEIVAAL
jgi:orotidine-5'-phosphate decarboxylase